MCKSGNTHQIRKVLGLGVQKHLHGKIRAELRYAKGSQWTAPYVVRHDPKGRGILEQAHDLPAVQRDILNRINANQVLEHTYHGRIIVPQDIQLQQVVVNGMVVKVGGHRGGGHIIGRVLYRGKGIDFLAQGKYDNTARVLSRGAAHAHAALHDPVDLAIALPCPPLLIILLHITESRLIRQCADGAGTEGLPLSKNDLGVIVGLTLIFTGEVKVDIRLLIPLKSKEGLKGNIKPVLFKGCTAHGTGLIRHIAARHAGKLPYLLGIKIIITAVGTVIMGA